MSATLRKKAETMKEKIHIPGQTDYYEEACKRLTYLIASCPKCTVNDYNELRDAMVSWFPYDHGSLSKPSRVESQALLDLIGKLYHKLKGKRARQTPQQAMSVVNVYDMYLDVFRHSQPAYDAVTALLEQAAHSQAVQ